MLTLKFKQGFGLEVSSVPSYLDVVLQNSTGATMLMRQQPEERPVESVLVLVDPARVRALVLSAPEGWMQRRMMLQCEVYCDAGVLGFTVPAVPYGPQQIEFPRPQDLTLIKHRSHVRVPTDLPVHLRPLHLPKGAPDPNRPGQHHLVVDISAGGIGLQTPYPLELGQELAVQFLYDPLAALDELPVRVVHNIKRGPPGVFGLAFRPLNNIVQSRLNEIVADLIREYRNNRRNTVRRWLE